MERPDPDALLDRLQRDEEKRRRGRLKVFFGASAGVGKTFAMLQAGRRRVQEGEDVVIGVVETHGREETRALLDGLETVPLRDVVHRGRAFPEFDLDAALARRPGLILMDELAHSNVAGTRHAKRWQDVHELLDAGIDVHTTVNVQHLESLNDIVGQITGVRVRETVPDRVFDLADEVSLIDLSAEELLERLRDGKVYLPQQAARAVDHFFRKGNLIALRELALRRTADRVDAQMREYRADRSIERLWQARERLVVCIGPGTESAMLVRSASRLAASLKADWLAVYVETPALQRLPDALRKRTLDALKLAAELGAETVTLEGADAAATLVAYARMRNVSRLVAGKPTRRRWARLLKPPFADQLAAVAGDFDLTSIADPRADGVPRPAQRPTLFATVAAGEPRPGWRAYAAASLIAAAVSALAGAVSDHMDLANLVMLYLLGVVFAAFRLGRGPGVYLSFLSVAAFDFFFVQPRMSFAISDTQYLLTFAVMLITSLSISHLTSRLRHQARGASRRERRTAAMYAMVRELGAALTDAQIIEIATRHISEVFGARMAILLPDSAERVRPKLEEPDPATALPPDALRPDVAQWVYDKQQAAGFGTDTLPASAAYYLPLKAPMRTRGVLALITARPDELALPEQQRLIDTFAAQIALALERVHYVEISRDALVGMESERLRNALLATISHDLRTPLTGIVGLAAVLSGGLQRADVPGAQSVELAEAIHDEALHMVSLVNNLLDMARLQAGGVRLDRQWSMLEEVVGAALAVCRRVLGSRAVTVRMPTDLPLVKLDAVLMERLLVNVLENACKYAHPGTALAIDAATVREPDGTFLKITIDDLGPGLTPGSEAAIFEKFARGEKESAQPGVGLGLAICRAIIEAHGGRIGARNRRDGGGQVVGASFWLTLPANEAPPEGAPPEMPEDDPQPPTLDHAP
ncbi:DUF4118 domain-containing protein [Robbsia sp. Bb-Pol-6]|uniref:histidine kinase n=1 Tax=Robbsia betulipollinis TaxID=2981849 RepID=A0ABT3ZJH9_9BURK|nr:DUF4118 domain-containing protein [Robbsia betulipollinis]MCY0386698.1 DUF4118 domain-containing protein [Robbsia betulipollinis]